MEPSDLERAVVDYYLASGDFNGLPAYYILRTSSIELHELRDLVFDLIRDGAIAVNLGDVHVNPHIRAFADPPIDKQLEKFAEFAGDRFVMYPTPAVLAAAVDESHYEGRPFTRRLALGEPQLAFESFDLAVIDHYRRDPRYHFWSNDVTATLSIGDEAYESEAFPEKHKVLIQHFGFSFDSDMRRAAAVFLTDLSGLTPEHQQIWDAYRLEGEYQLHPDFYRAAILGDWGLKASLRDAFIEELRVINEMCAAVGWPPLFRQVPESPPNELSFLIRPTVDEFNAFVHTLDKLLSENINQEFFPQNIERESEEVRADGKIVVRPRGTIQMLEQWLTRHFRPDDPALMRECIRTLRKVRKRRQKPAHAIITSEYNEQIFEDQRDLFVEAYSALRTLRLVIQNHPSAAPVAESMIASVREGEIWAY